MSLFWPIFWLGGMVVAVGAFLVALFLERARQRAASKILRDQARTLMTSPEEKVGSFVAPSLDFPEEPLPG